MNCLAHGIKFLDNPWFLVGTGMPDWLSMVDRKVRLRPKHIDPACDNSGEPTDQIARGIQQHWTDDEWFHRSVAFHEVSAQIGVLFKNAHGSGDGFRSGFIGHICMEMLIDAVLTERNPGALDRYYEQLSTVDFTQVQAIINGYGARETQMVEPFLNRYVEDQFLRDYTDDAKLLWRLNRVLNRVRLEDLPDDAHKEVAASREIVRERCDELLTP